MIDLKKFVALTGQTGQLRRVFFDGIEQADKELLASRGYEAVNLMELPRGSVAEDQGYLFALLQGMTEGTIEVSKDRINAAELELRARHMLSANAPPIQQASAISVENVRDLWNWSDSRHTLQGNSTIVDPEKINALATKAAPQKKRGRE